MSRPLALCAIAIVGLVATSTATTPTTGASIVSVTALSGVGRLDYNATTNRLAFDAYDLDGFYDVYIRTYPSGTATCITCDHADLTSPNRNHGQPAWTHDGQWILFQKVNGDHASCTDLEEQPGSGLCTDLWVCKADASDCYELYTVAGGGVGGLLHPSVSEDDTKVFFSERTVETPSEYELVVCDIEFVGTPSVSGCVGHQPAEADGFYESHQFMNGGTDELLFSCVCDAADDGFDDFDIAVYTISTMTYKKLTNTDNIGDEHAHQAPDGRIVWGSSWSLDAPGPLRYDWGIMNQDGSFKQRLTFFNAEWHPDYIEDFSIAADFAWVSNNHFVGFLMLNQLNQTGLQATWRIGTRPVSTFRR